MYNNSNNMTMREKNKYKILGENKIKQKEMNQIKI